MTPEAEETGADARPSPGRRRPPARPLPRRLARRAVAALVRAVYRIRLTGGDRLPAGGGVLVVANHLTYVDALVLGAACPRELRFVMFDEMASRPFIRPIVRLFGVIPISSRRARDAIRLVREALARGEAVCVFPEGQMSRTGWLHEMKRGFELMVGDTGAPVVPAFLDGLWGSVFSFSGGRFFPKLPRRIPYRVRVRFGDPMPAPDRSNPGLRDALTHLAAAALADRKGLDEPLDRSLARALARAPWRPALVTASPERRRTTLDRAATAATAAALARRWEQGDRIPGRRVAVLLPPGIATTLAQLALVFAGRVPVAVPLDPGASATRLRHAFDAFDIQSAVTTGAVRESLPAESLPPAVLDISTEIRACTGARLLLGTLAALLAPLGCPRPHRTAHPPRSADDEALARLVPRNGEWRLVARTHRQTTATLHQLLDLDLVRPSTRLASTLPADAPGGWLFGFALPLWAGIPLVPISAGHVPARVAAAIEAAGADWLVTDPAGRDALDAAPPERPPGASTLRLVTSAATTANPATKAGLLPATFDADTDTLVAISLPDALPPTSTAWFQPGSRPGTLGHFPNGLHLRLVPGGLHLEGPSTPPGGLTLPGTVDPDGFLSLHPASTPDPSR